MPYEFTRDDIVRRDEMDKILLNAKHRWVHSLSAFLYIAGARINEALSLTLDDVKWDDENLYVKIPYSKQGKKAKSRGPIRAPSHILTISLDAPYVREIIIPYMQKIKSSYSRLWPVSRSKAYRFIKRLHPKGELSPHVLRHSRLQLLSEQEGVTPQALMSFAGWSSIKTADSYIQGSPAHAALLKDKFI